MTLYLGVVSPVDIRWDNKKYESRRLANLLIQSSDKYISDIGYRMYYCSDFLEFSSKDEKGVYLSRSNFCRSSICPLCQWRRALKFRNRLKSIDFSNKNNRWRFLTLTIKNCLVDDLSDTLDILSKSFLSLVRGRFSSWIKCIEITLASPYCHPHIHCLYQGVYLNHSQWVSLWQSILNVSYLPSVRISSVKSNYGATFELIKYICKYSSYSFNDIGFLTDFIYQIKNRRFFDCGGVVRSKLRNDKNDTDLILVDGSQSQDFKVQLKNFYFRCNYSAVSGRYEVEI